MKIVTKDILIRSSPEKVFAYMDNLGNTGMHMMESSAMMMGSKLQLKQLSENATGLYSKFRWFGKMMGFMMDFTVVVTKWIKDKEKIWETIGEAKMIILKWYRMQLTILPAGQNTKAELSITYTKPDNIFFRLIAFFLAPWYANWCLKNMLNDTKHSLESGSYVKKGIKKFKPSVIALTSGGLLLIAIGVYFVFLRPPLFAEDSRYIGMPLTGINNQLPGLTGWLKKIFWVLGGYIFTSGLLTTYIANTSFRKRLNGAFAIVTMAGISSIGFMTAVNFMIDSDFKWFLLTFTVPWVIALVLYRFHK
jgi:hypothetical protein